jgi:hypothetical protein
MTTARLPHVSAPNDLQTRRRYNELADAVQSTGSLSTGTGDVGSLQSQITTLQQNQFVTGVTVSGTSPGGANTEFSIAHNLGRIPAGYFVMGTNIAGVLYQLAGTGTAWTTSNIFVKANVGSLQFKVFIT